MSTAAARKIDLEFCLFVKTSLLILLGLRPCCMLSFAAPPRASRSRFPEAGRAQSWRESVRGMRNENGELVRRRASRWQREGEVFPCRSRRMTGGRRRRCGPPLNVLGSEATICRKDTCCKVAGRKEVSGMGWVVSTQGCRLVEPTDSRCVVA
jgi:hypothetical protein